MSQFALNAMERVARERQWDRLLAKSETNGQQSILSHAKSVAGVAEKFAESFGLAQDRIELLRVAAFLHDLGKEKKEFQESLTSGKKTTHLPSIENIRSYLEAISVVEEDYVVKVFFVIIETHRGVGETEAAMRAVTELVGRGETPDLIRLGEIIRLSDWIASSDSPTSAWRSTRHDFLPLLKGYNTNIEYYSLLRIRGVLTYLLHRGIQAAYKTLGYDSVAVYPEGCLLIGTQPLDQVELRQKIREQLKNLLDKALLDKAFLVSATALQINRAMIANPGIVALESLHDLIEYGANTVSSLPNKTDDQKRAILMRFISTLQNAIRTKIEDADLDVPEELSIIETEVFGLDFGEIGLPMDYSLWGKLTKKASSVLVKNKIVSRDLDTLDIAAGTTAMKNAYQELIKRMAKIFDGDAFSFISNMETEAYLEPLLSDIQYPVISNDEKKEPNSSNYYHSLAHHTLATYQSAKDHVMGKMEGDVRCPICGTAGLGTTAISAGVGPGTKKFINSGIGAKRLENINVCTLCILEGILRGEKAQGYVLLPQISFSPQEAEALEEIAITHLAKLDRNVYKTASMFLKGDIDVASKKLQSLLETLCSSDREPYGISRSIIGNYVLMTTYSEKSGSLSDNLAKAVFQGLILHYLLDVRVLLLTGFEMIDIYDKQGAVQFEGTSTLLRILGSRTGRVHFNDSALLARRLAAALLAKLSAKLSDNNGIIQALNTHPGQLAQRIALDRKTIRFSDHDLQILSILNEGKNMTSITDMTVRILDEYYRPEKYGSSMHSVLGPMNSLYTEFRKAHKLDQEAIESIAGRVHRQLQQLNKGDYMLSEAATPILELCTELATQLENAGPRDRKRILDDLRYSVYLRRLISINERMRKKKNGGN